MSFVIFSCIGTNGKETEEQENREQPVYVSLQLTIARAPSVTIFTIFFTIFPASENIFQSQRAIRTVAGLQLRPLPRRDFISACGSPENDATTVTL